MNEYGITIPPFPGSPHYVLQNSTLKQYSKTYIEGENDYDPNVVQMSVPEHSKRKTVDISRLVSLARVKTGN